MVSLDDADNVSKPGRGVTAGTVSDRDVATERTWMYLQRVLAVTPRPGSHEQVMPRVDRETGPGYKLGGTAVDPTPFFITACNAGR